MWRDIRLAARALAHAPGFTLVATVALALAIGANGAIFGLVDALWLRPPGVRDPGTLVRVFATTPAETSGVWSWDEYREIAAGVRGFETVAVRGRRGAVLTARDGSQDLILVNVVSTNFFEMLDVRPFAGRLFSTAGDDDTGAAAVLGHAFWRSQFGGDPSIVGRQLQLGRGQAATITVVGVLPPDFRELDAAADRDVWLTPAAWQLIAGGAREFEGRDNRWFDIVARRQPASSISAIDAEVEAAVSALAATAPSGSAMRGARVVSDLDHRLQRAGTPAGALLGLVLLVVVISCVNVANLMMARAAARHQELAVRVALGASRWRLARQLAGESVILGALGAAGGLIIASWLIRLLPSLMIAPPGFRSFLVFQMDARVMLFTAVLTILTTMLVGLAPAWLGARTNVVGIIKASSGASAPGGRLRRLLVAGQVAISLVLLCVALALARSYAETQRTDVGFSRAPVLTLWTTAGLDDPAITSEAVRQLAALPGVSAVAVAIRAPLSLSGGGMAAPVTVPGATRAPGDGVPDVKFNAVSANYFDTLGTKLLGGRSFTESEARGGEATVVVNAAFVERYLGGRDPLGTLIDVSGAPHRVIGVAQDGVVNEIGEPPQPYMYLPFWRGHYGEATFLLATAGEPGAIARAARALLRRVHPDLEPRRTISMAEYLDYATAMHRTTAALASLFGAVGLLLTAIGVYGVVAYSTTRRAKEIGIRMALGAARGQVVRLVLRDGLVLGLAGTVLGIPLALIATNLASSFLVGIDAWDAEAFASAALVLLAGVTLATWIPARRAAHAEPSTALRR
jgi:putative ABC transport system permease protein